MTSIFCTFHLAVFFSGFGGAKSGPLGALERCKTFLLERFKTSKSGTQKVKKPGATDNFEIFALLNLKVVCSRGYLMIFDAQKGRNQS